MLPLKAKFCCREKGAVLIVVLVILQLISMLSLYLLEMNTLEIKMTNNNLQHHQLFVLSNLALQKIETELAQQVPSCIVAHLSSHVLYARSLKWWRSIATCTSNFQSIQYYYVLEKLDADPCERIEGTAFSTIHYRISLLGFLKPSMAGIRLQSIVKLPYNGPAQFCPSTEHEVAQGRQMWREYIN